jgi:zinc/manganese transport system ATP-binding protein
VSGERPAVVEARGLRLQFGDRLLWDDLGLDLHEGEFLAVLGPNGTGKTSLVRILLGLLAPAAGSVRVSGREPALARAEVGYVPQQHAFDPDAPLRGCDLVRLGLDGHRWGLGLRSRGTDERVRKALADVGATGYCNVPVGRLSGGEQQRLRIAQALVSDPALLLADEPLLSLDLASQRVVVDLLDRRRREAGTPVVFVTHDVNPILRVADRVLYLAPGRWAMGAPAQVLTTETLSKLYDTPIDVLQVRGRIVVVGTPDDEGVHHHEHAHAGTH